MATLFVLRIVSAPLDSRAPLDADGGEVFTRAIEHVFENGQLRMMLEVLL